MAEPPSNAPGPAPIAGAVSAAALPSLAALMDDQRARFRRGEPALVEDYLAEHSALGSDPEALLDLIYNEIVLREQRGDVPSRADYLRRFPHLAEPVSDLFEVHEALRFESVADNPPTDQPSLAGPAAGSAADPAWPVIDGYDILDVLGSGGMGVVYKAHDRRRGAVVALKTMQRVDAASLYRFKQEFRSLLDVSHPNLVNLYELVSDGRNWFMTMELIDGVDFLRYVRTAPAAAELAGDADTQFDPSTLPLDSDEREPVDPTIRSNEVPSSSRPMAAADPLPPECRLRLRDALRQLAEAIAALHASGKLHRDIKPSNVLVNRSGRVVLMDFGLATERDRDGLAHSTEGQVVGTAAYMPPEQASGGTLSTAGDWYSVGVIVYQALTGRLPFLGDSLAILMDKQRYEPPPPRELVADVPEDLDALCVELLRRDPRARPSGAEILRRLGSAPTDSLSSSSHSSSSQTADRLLIGRERHQRALHSAFEAVRGGRTIVLDVHGRSGVGKSALVQHFLDALAREGQAVVLSGRCYERESVPYKALDSLIDALSRHLRRVPEADAKELLPRDVGPLARVFPVLRRVQALATAPRRPFESPDPQELRRRAFAALRELLARLGDRHPLVLAIDDLQWGDADSIAALSEVLRPPDPPALLLLACYRTEDRPGSPLLLARLALEAAPGGAECRELAVEPLSVSEAADLALALIGRTDGPAHAHAQAIARESGGNPLFVAELVRSVLGDRGDGLAADGQTIALDEVLWSRIVRLPDEPRRLLEAIAVSGRPIRPAVAWRSLGLQSDERTALALLRSGRLVRGTALAEEEEVETYHDRVRETIVAHLGADALRNHHARLAVALEDTGRADPEVLGVHFHRSGELAKAAGHYARAAALAAEALAFDRAAKLYRLALDLRPDPADAGSLRAGLADALANAGRGAEAAGEYLAAAERANVAEAFELRRRAAMQFLISGHIDQGLAALQTVLAAVGMRLPGTPRRALWSFLLHRGWLRLRGLGYRERDPSEIAPAELARIDVCWSAGAGLSVVDWIRGADFQTRGLLLALRAGDLPRIARALAMEAAHVAAAGRPARGRTAALLRTADSLAERSGHPYALGMIDLARGVSSYLEGRWRDALIACGQAEQALRDRCTGVAWELDTAQAFALWALTHLGEIAELARRYPRLLAEARERGDLYAAMNLSTYILSVARLADDAPGPARDELGRMRAQWSREGYHVQHNDQLWASVQVELYLGDGASAWALLRRHWPALSGSLLLRVQFIRASMWSLRARAALAASPGSPDPRPLLDSAARDARRLAREDLPWSLAYARLIQGLLAATRHDLSSAVGSLTESVDRFAAADMHLCAASVRRRLGSLLGGDQGRALVESADTWMTAQAIRNPARLAAMYAPEVGT